mmetsp:Transcript_31993/g.46751  ORF Transcript_31993/g.46751 Transcript_31993/m.46751 type:complete len:148 (+) Transcript_31993:24-467(+)
MVRSLLLFGVALMALPQIALSFSSVHLPMLFRASPSLSARGLHSPIQLQHARMQIRAPKMMLDGGDGAIYLADEIFTQVATGGIGIILSGVVGAFIVGSIANIENLEANFNADRKQSESVAKDNVVVSTEDDYYTGDGKASEKEISK